MKSKIEYRLQNLMWRDKNDKVTGEINTVDFIIQMARIMDFIPNGLVRINFFDPEYNNSKTGKKGSKNDTLMVIQRFKNDDWAVYVFVRQKDKGIPVGIMFNTDTEFTITRGYTNSPYLKIITGPEWREIITEAVVTEQFNIPLASQQNN